MIVNDPSDPLGPLGDWLSEAGVELEVVNAFAETPPASLDGFDGLLVLGGPMGANDDGVAPWLPAVRALLADAVAAELPTLGICLGGQLLAVATGGRSALNPDGPEYGAQLIAKRANAATDPLFGSMPITPDVIQWHVDAVTQLPPGAVLLANSPGCDVQAFRVGRSPGGPQFHIETTPAIVRTWAAEDADELDGYDVDRLLARSDAAHEDIAEVWRPFARGLGGHRRVTRPSVRPARTLRISHGRAGHRPGRDPRGAGRSDAGRPPAESAVAATVMAAGTPRRADAPEPGEPQ